MVRQLLGVFFFITAVFAEPVIHIGNEPTKLENFNVGYFVDHTEKLSFEAVQKEQFKTIENRFSLGINVDVTWVKILLHNDSHKTQQLFIHNIYTYLSYDTRFYEVLHGETVGKIKYIMPLNHNTDKLKGAEAVYQMSLEPQQSKTLYIRSYFKAYQMIDLGIYDAEHSQENLIRKFVPVVVMVTILMTLGFYYFVLFLYGRYKEYAYYALYLISSSLFISYTYGMLTHYFYIYGNMALILSAVIIIPPIFLSLFAKAIFQTKGNYILENRILNSFILLFSLTYLSSFFYYYQAIEFTSLLYLYFFFGMLWISISLFKKRVPLVGYFLVAHVFYLVSSFVAIFFYNGLLPFNGFTVYALGFGSMIEAIMLGFLVSYRVRLLENDNRIKDEQLVVDKMTGLYNKSYFEENLQKNILDAKKKGGSFALLIIDIDYFKQFNDSYGHFEGDKALVAVANVLGITSRRVNDMVFRIGGEEFAIFTKREIENVQEFGKRIQHSIQELEIEHKSSTIADHITISIGIHIVRGKTKENAEEAYRAVDEALYLAKSQGRDRIVCSWEA